MFVDKEAEGKGGRTSIATLIICLRVVGMYTANPLDASLYLLLHNNVA